MEQSPSWKTKGFSASEEILHILSLPRLQEPAICPYPEPDKSSPCPSIPLHKDPS